MRNTLLLIVLSALVAPALVGADLNEPYASWADGAEQLLMTEAERSAWALVQTDDEAREFIGLFWLRRDPDLDTIANEALNEFVGRVAFADETYSTDAMRGALTDRGKVLILLGAPYRVEKRGPTHTLVTIDRNPDGTDEVWAKAELWEYLPKDLPVEMKGPDVVFVFYEKKMAAKVFTLDRSHKDGPRALRVLSLAPEALVVNPDLTETPKIPES